MISHLAIAAATTCLREMITPAAQRAVPSVTISTARPDGAGSGIPGARVNIYLYQAQPNAAYRNTDLPTRDSRGTYRKRPRAALDLHYLISFYGDETVLEPQRLMGSVVTVLAASPIFSQETIRNILEPIANQSGHYLAGADFSETPESLRLTPISLNLEELSKIWSVFFQTPYALSTAYRCAAVLMDADVNIPALPAVYSAGLEAGQGALPSIAAVGAEKGFYQPIFAGNRLRIQGTALAGDIMRVRVDDTEITPDEIEEKSMLFTLPSGLLAGLHGVQVLSKVSIGGDPLNLRNLESNALSFILRPSITGVTVTDPVVAGDGTSSASLHVDVTPGAGSEQQVVLLLNEKSGANSYVFSPRLPREADPTKLIFDISGVEPADYFLRLRVEGAESILTLDPDTGTFTGPLVNLIF